MNWVWKRIEPVGNICSPMFFFISTRGFDILIHICRGCFPSCLIVDGYLNPPVFDWSIWVCLNIGIYHIPLNSMLYESVNIFPVKLVNHCTVPIISQVDFPLYNFHIFSPSQRLSRLSTFPLEWTATSTANKTCRPETGGSRLVNYCNPQARFTMTQRVRFL